MTELEIALEALEEIAELAAPDPRVCPQCGEPCETCGECGYEMLVSDRTISGKNILAAETAQDALTEIRRKRALGI